MCARVRACVRVCARACVCARVCVALSVCLCLSLSVSVCLCLSLSVSVSGCVPTQAKALTCALAIACCIANVKHRRLDFTSRQNRSESAAKGYKVFQENSTERRTVTGEREPSTRAQMNTHGVLIVAIGACRLEGAWRAHPCVGHTRPGIVASGQRLAHNTQALGRSHANALARARFSCSKKAAINHQQAARKSNARMRERTTAGHRYTARHTYLQTDRQAGRQADRQHTTRLNRPCVVSSPSSQLAPVFGTCARHSPVP